MNKKAIFIPTLTILILFLLSYAFYVFVVKEKVVMDEIPRLEKVGMISLELMEKKRESKENLLYINQAAKYSMYQALVELGENGGFKELPETCEKKDGYVVWHTACNPSDSIQDTLLEYFKEIFESYLKDSDYNYIIEIENNHFNLIGTANDLILKSDHIEYRIDPSFKKRFEYDISIYKTLFKQYNNLNKCEDTDEFCETGDDHISIEIPTGDLPFLKPVIKFRIERPKELFEE